MPTATSTITVEVKDRASRETQLEDAISLLREKAAGFGVAVTKVNFTTFTVSPSPETMFGLTREVDLL